MLSRNKLCLPTVLPLAWTLLVHTAAGQVYDTPEQAKSDPDFPFQGEYVDATRGLQVIALGKGEFELAIYPGGLPGQGWSGENKQSLEVDVDQLQDMLKSFERVERTSPTLGAKPPAGAVVLFDGTQAALAEHWREGARITEDGLLMEGCTSRETFGDYAMHLEFRLPFMPAARGQQRGNSGLYHQGRYETQILDSFGLEGKANEAGGLYSLRAPDINMCFPPLSWQTYDIDFLAARFDGSGKKTADAQITVKLNGVVVHRDVALPRTTTAAPVKMGPEDGPIYLQNHGNPVRYRNIWVMPRDVEAERRRPVVPGFERFHVTAGDPVEGGRLLLGELNCVACHAAENATFAAKQAPVLDHLGRRVRPEWLLQYLVAPHETKPGTTMPDLLAGLPAARRDETALALTHFLIGEDVLLQGGPGANTRQGERLFHEAGCTACHLPRDGRKAATSTSIPLGDLGGKYSRASLEQFLRDPLAARPSGRMPRMDLGGDNWRHVAQYLTGDEAVEIGKQRQRPKQPNLRFSAYYGSYDQLPDLEQLEPDLTGAAHGFDIAVGQRTENVVIRFDGYLPIEKAGEYRFQIASDDGSKMYIDGELLLDNDGVHGVETQVGTLHLTPGKHAIRVDYFEKSGGEELYVDWAGPGIEGEPMDTALVMDRSQDESPAPPPSPAADEFTYTFDAELAQQGQALFANLGCANCHARSDRGSRVQSQLVAPALTACAVDEGCLAEQPGKSVVHYDLAPNQRAAIQASLAASDGLALKDSAARLAHTMKALNCLACHARDGLGGPESDRNRLFVSSIREMGDEGRLPPPLDGVGDKLRESWIETVVQQGDKSRPYMQTHMPGFGKQHGKSIADWFSTLDQRSEAQQSEQANAEPSNRQIANGRTLVGAKGLACVNCHTYGKFRASGIQAIALDTMTQRIREDWFHRYLPDPQVYRPGTRMPTGFPDGQSTVTEMYGGDPQQQLSAIWSFLEQGDRGGVPEGIVGGMIELKPNDKPVIYRNFIEGVSPRGIAVGYPEKINLCWDANYFSLNLVWPDRFLDASKHWVGRGPGNQVPLGGPVLRLEATAPIAVLANAKAPWPEQPPRQRGFRFLGYQLDAHGRPTFRYRTPWALVEDQPFPVVRDGFSSIRRRVTITPEAAATGSERIYFRLATGDFQVLGNRIEIAGGPTFDYECDAPTVLRQTGGHSELLVPIEGPTTIVQQLVW